MHPTTANLVALTLLAIEAQQVIALRMMRLMAGGAAADRESQRMVMEKVWALAHTGMAAATSMALGGTAPAAAHDAIRHYRGRVRVNRTRLRRR